MRPKKCALMAVGVSGYHSSLGQDVIKLMQLMRARTDLVESSITSNNGKLLRRSEDTFLVSFPTPLNALNCAFAIESSDTEQQTGESKFHQINLQIGLHLGSDDLASLTTSPSDFDRALLLARKAEPGEVTISDAFMQQAGTKLGVNSLRQGVLTVGNDNEVLRFSAVNPVLLPRRQELVSKKSLSIGAVVAGLGLVFALIQVILQGAETSFIRDLFTSKKNDANVSQASFFDLPEAHIDSNRVAVMPLKNLTGDDRLIYYSQGLAEDLIFRLSQIKDLYVYPLSDVISINADQKTSRQVHDALGAKYLIQGSYQLDNDSIVVFIEVIDAEKMQRISSEEIVGARNETRDLNKRVARSILFPIVGRVSGEAEAALAAFSSTSSYATDLYMKALQASRKAQTWDEVQASLRLFEATVKADTNFAIAHARLSYEYSNAFGRWSSDTTLLNLAEIEAIHAQRLAPKLPETEFALGSLYWKRSRFDEAAAAYRRALELRPNYYDAMLNLANMLSFASKVDESAMLYHRIIATTQAMGDRQREADALINCGFLFHLKAEFDSAFAYFDASKRIAAELGNESARGRALYNIGQTLVFSGQEDSAKIVLAEALKVFSEIGDEYNLARIYNALGNATSFSVDYQLKLEYFQKGLDKAVHCGNILMQGAIQSNIASVYRNCGEYEKALKMYQVALDLHRRAGNKMNEANVLNMMGTVYSDGYQNYEEAENHFRASLEIYLQFNNSVLAQTAAGSLQNLYLKFGKLEETIAQGDYMVQLMKNDRDKDFAIWAYDNMAKAFAFMGDTANAHDRFRRADSLAGISTGRGLATTGSIYHETNCERALICAQLGDLASANLYIEKSRQYVDSTKVGQDLQEIRLWQAKALYWAGRLPESVDTLHKAVADSIFDPLYNQFAHVLYGAGLVELGDEAKGMPMLNKYYPIVKKTGWVENQFTADRAMGRALGLTGKKREAVALLTEAKKQAHKVGYYGFIPIFDRELQALEKAQ